MAQRDNLPPLEQLCEAVEEAAESQPPKKGRERSKFTISQASTSYQPIPKSFLFTTGNGEMGQLGLGVHYLETKYPMWVKMDHEIIGIHAGLNHSVCVSDKGVVLTFGHNGFGQLGRLLDADNTKFSPGVVQLPGKAIQVTAGECHTVALLDNGHVYAWGDFKDSYGTIGLTLGGQQALPVLMFSKEPVVKIASGFNHFVALTKSGVVCTIGCSEYGQLGRIPDHSATRYCQNSMEKHLALYPIKIDNDLKFENIWAGGDTTLAKVKDSNDVYAWGYNQFRQLGIADPQKIYMPTVSPDFSQYSWKNIRCTLERSIGLDINKKVYVLGRQEGGRLGLGYNIRSTPMLTSIPCLEGLGVSEIGIGADCSFAATDEMGLIVWGTGSSGELGTGDIADRLNPFAVSSRALENKRIVQMSGGVRHSMILAFYVDRPNM
ncbi:regulator of chromosome condensation-like [Onthophagus taurus]|uniref:regulator of chromosome condensation-like n=1 Tax=Onthophagus taurus TaxID=166361 RepID=UPI0039BEC121